MAGVGRLAYGLCLALVGGVLATGGVRLIVLGGSPYYLAAGIAVASSGAALLLARWRVGSLIYAIMLAVTLAWALIEVGLDGWALAPRLVSPAVLGLPFLLFALLRGGGWERIGALGFFAATVLLSIGVYQAAQFEPVGKRAYDERFVAVTGGDRDWSHFGGDVGGSRYSRLTDIGPANVGRLKLAWTIPLGPLPQGPIMQNQAVPIKVGDSLYTCTPWNKVVAVDPETGRTRWQFDPAVGRTGVYQVKCRGVAYYAMPSGTGVCARRLYTATVDGRLIALDAQTGAKCLSFGNRGEANLLRGVSERSRGYYAVTSAPTVVRGRIIVGGSISDGQYVGEPSGVVRAYDAVTGKLAWAWDIGRTGQRGDLPPGGLYTSGTPNVWAPMSGDEALGLVYMPTGAATPDYWGGHRSAQTNRYGNSIVALDVLTGEASWSFQTVHYDVWDYDVASQPTLFDLRTDRGTVPALVQPTKRGQLFILDRRTGIPIFPVVERPAPQRGAVERLSPTQPWSVAFPDLSGPRVTEASMWGLTAVDQLWCRIKFREARYEGQMTPPGVTASIADPGYIGGMDWGGASIDAERGLLILPSNHLANYIRLIPRSDPKVRGLRPSPTNELGGLAGQEGTPFAADIRPFFSPLQMPCQAPPYGRLNAIDLRSGKLLWTRPIGSARDLGPALMRSHLPFTIGTPTTGGALATRSGLTFIGATPDHVLRAFDSATGRQLFTADLPGPAFSTPMTYRSSRTGRQFLVVSSEAPGKDGAYHAALTAWALPR